MSTNLGNLCSLIIGEHFGKTVRAVTDDLFGSVAKTLPLIVKSTKLNKTQVSNALATLLRFGLAKFGHTSNENIPEYSVLPDKILLILRYPRYTHFIQKKFGSIAVQLTEEILRSGSECASTIILKSVLHIESKNDGAIAEHRDKFVELVQANYFIRSPTNDPESSNTLVPKLTSDDGHLFLVPEISLTNLQKAVKKEKVTFDDALIHWRVNIDRFHQDFKDSLLIMAVERKIDANAAECLKWILQIMYQGTDPMKASSNPITFGEIRHLCEKKSNNMELIRYLDQYLTVLAESTINLLSKSGDAGGGQYTVQTKDAIEHLTWSCIESIVTEKFGSKAARIFRVIRFRKYIEQEDIQRQAMVPAKEAKQLTYKLLTEHFLQIHTIRKAGGGGAGLAKSFFLFYVNQHQIVSMILETCYQAMFNAITRSVYDKSENRRLIDKSQRLESVVEAMKDRGESEEYIEEILETLTPPEREHLQKVKIRVKNLYSAEIGLDETLFLFQLYKQFENV